MKFTKKPTERCMLEMCRRLKGVTGDAIEIRLDTWKHRSDNEQLQYTLWNGLDHSLKHTATWEGFIDLYKEELANAVKHSRSS